ncbi:MAG TPA: TRAP transporter small permease [Burkholderiales bacterium]|nr:TRAP transporter small permease [Burkholderiales bacterium]
MLRKFEAIASRALGVIAAAALFAMMLLTFVDVIGRYGFHHSIFGAAEIVECLMMVSVFAGLAFITARNEHISVTLLEPLVMRVMPGAQRWASLAMSAGCTLLICWQMFRHAQDLLASAKRTAVLELPQWLLPMSAAVLSLAGLALLLLAIARTRGRLDAASTHYD